MELLANTTTHCQTTICGKPCPQTKDGKTLTTPLEDVVVDRLAEHGRSRPNSRIPLHKFPTQQTLAASASTPDWE